MQRAAQWHETRLGLLTFAVIELALAYWLGSLAINSGSWWQWLLTLILLLGVAQNLWRMLFRKVRS